MCLVFYSLLLEYGVSARFDNGDIETVVVKAQRYTAAGDTETVVDTGQRYFDELNRGQFTQIAANPRGPAMGAPSNAGCPRSSVVTGAVSATMPAVEAPELLSFAMAVRAGTGVAEAASELGPYGLVGGLAVGAGTYAADRYSNGAVSNFMASKLGICGGG